MTIEKLFNRHIQMILVKRREFLTNHIQNELKCFSERQKVIFYWRRIAT